MKNIMHPTANRIASFRRESKKIKIIKLLVYTVFLVTQIIISIMHEPWFDEAQAWQIAKTESYYNILFKVLHHEGHPPLWYLILSVPAKLGVPYEFGIKSVAYIISVAVAYLLIFHSPFPVSVQLLLPFNYFIFYQYGVFARPYSLILLFLILLAMLYPQKDDKPVRFTAVLAGLCLTHAYAFVIAGGIAACWLFEILREKGINRCIREAVADRRILSLIVLLLLAILVILEILPAKDNYALQIESKNPLWKCLLCTVFTMIPDCLVFKSDWFSADRIFLKKASITWYALLPTVVIGVLVWFVIWAAGSRKNFKYFCVPYLLFSVFSSMVYMVSHHIGISLELLIFWLWIDLNDQERFSNWNRLVSKVDEKTYQTKLTKTGIRGLALCCLLIPLYWTVYASVNDMTADYSYGRGMYHFLRDTKLDEAVIFTEWDEDLLTEESEEKQVFLFSDPTFLAYFDRNIIANTTNDNNAYVSYRLIEKDEAVQIVNKWKEQIIPEVLFGYIDIEKLYPEVKNSDYSLVYIGNVNYFYKDGKTVYKNPVYLRNDLLEQYGLEPLDPAELNGSSIEITQELREAYERGEISLEDIINGVLGDYGMTEEKS